MNTANGNALWGEYPTPRCILFRGAGTGQEEFRKHAAHAAAPVPLNGLHIWAYYAVVTADLEQLPGL